MTLIEHDLERAERRGQQRKSDEIEICFPVKLLAFLVCCSAVLDENVNEPEREQADRRIDEEHPVPRVIVSDPAAESWAYDRCDDDGDAIKRKCLSAFFWRKGICQD